MKGLVFAAAVLVWLGLGWVCVIVLTTWSRWLGRLGRVGRVLTAKQSGRSGVALDAQDLAREIRFHVDRDCARCRTVRGMLRCSDRRELKADLIEVRRRAVSSVAARSR